MATSTAIDLGEMSLPQLRRPTLRTRVAARLRARQFDEQLAAGADPLTDPALTLRARWLLAPWNRARIADGIDRTLRTVEQPHRLSAQAPLNRRAVVAARPELQALSAELRDDTDVRAQGVALARLLLVDAMSPLYHHDGQSDGAADELLGVLRTTYRALRNGEVR